MKIITVISLILAIILIISCSNNTSTNEHGGLKTGGLYISKNDDGTYSASKILVLDDFAAHIRMYSNKFQTKPSDLNSADLDFLIGHAPIDKKGFLSDHPELIKVEKVSEEELEGYRYYLDAMNQQ